MTPFEEILKLIPELSKEELGRLRYELTQPWWAFQKDRKQGEEPPEPTQVSR